MAVPTVTTQNCSDILQRSVTGNGTVTATGGSNATRRGFAYMPGASGDPIAGIDLVTAEHTGTGDPAIVQQVIATSVDCTGLTKANGFLVIDLKCDHPELMTGEHGSLEITSSGGADTNEWAINLSTLTTDYVTYVISLDTAITTGGELDVSAINFIRIYSFSSGVAITLAFKNARIYISHYSVYDDGDFGTGPFTKSITGLTAGTDYRVSAYAVNADGIAYGSTVDLTTDTFDIATAAGAVTTAGSAVGIFRGKGFVTAPGAVTTDGTAVGLLSTRLLGVNLGAVAVSGQAVTLNRTIPMVIEAGAVTTAGTATSFLLDRLLATASGAVTTAGTATSFLLDRLLATASGAVTTAGTDLDFIRWHIVLIGEYPDLVTAARHRAYIVETLSDRLVFTVEVTGGDYLVTREVDLLSGVVAGQDKTVALNALVCPFFDASFAIDGDLVSAVNYKIDAGAKTAIPAGFGTDLADRVRSFSLSFDSSGEKRLTLYVTDDDSNEYSDELIVRVSA